MGRQNNAWNNANNSYKKANASAKRMERNANNLYKNSMRQVNRNQRRVNEQLSGFGHAHNQKRNKPELHNQYLEEEVIYQDDIDEMEGHQRYQSHVFNERYDGTIIVYKNKWVSFFLSFFFGWTGAHKFYEGKIVSGLIYLLLFFFDPTHIVVALFSLLDAIYYLFRPREYGVRIKKWGT